MSTVIFLLALFVSKCKSQTQLCASYSYQVDCDVAGSHDCTGPHGPIITGCDTSGCDAASTVLQQIVVVPLRRGTLSASCDMACAKCGILGLVSDPNLRAAQIQKIKAAFAGKRRRLEDSVIDDSELIINAPRFHYITTPLSYNDAQEYCRNNYNMDLATISSADDISTALDVMTGSSAWTGLRGVHSDGFFEWAQTNDICSNCPYDYSGACIDFWVIGHPRCVIDEHGNYEWSDDYQGDGYSFTTFNNDGKMDNNIPGDVEMPFFCNGVVPRCECPQGEVLTICDNA